MRPLPLADPCLALPCLASPCLALETTLWRSKVLRGSLPSLPARVIASNPSSQSQKEEALRGQMRFGFVKRREGLQTQQEIVAAVTRKLRRADGERTPLYEQLSLEQDLATGVRHIGWPTGLQPCPSPLWRTAPSSLDELRGVGHTLLCFLLCRSPLLPALAALPAPARSPCARPLSLRSLL